MPQTKLQQQSGEPDRCDHHQRDRTAKRASSGVDHDQSQRKEQQTGPEDSWPARLGVGQRVGSGVRQWNSVGRVIQGWERAFQLRGGPGARCVCWGFSICNLKSPSEMSSSLTSRTPRAILDCRFKIFCSCGLQEHVFAGSGCGGSLRGQNSHKRGGLGAIPDLGRRPL